MYRIAALLLLVAGCQTLPIETIAANPSPAPEPRANAEEPAYRAAFAIPRLTAKVREDVEAQFLAETNQLRAGGGAAPLVRDARLDRAARRYAEYLAAHGILEHEVDVPGMRTPELRAAAEGAMERYVGETLALLASTPESAARRTVQLWSESPDHRRVMLRSAYRRAGIGIAMDDERVLYVVQMYAPGD